MWSSEYLLTKFGETPNFTGRRPVPPKELEISNFLDFMSGEEIQGTKGDFAGINFLEGGGVKL